MPVGDAASLVGREVESVDGEPVGSVVAVHHAPDADVLIIEVRADTGTERAVPLLDVVAQGRIVLPYPLAVIDRGPSTGPGDRLSVGEVAALCAYYRIGRVDLTGRDLTERVAGFGDVGSQDPALRPLPPIVVIRPSQRPPDRDGPSRG